MEGVRFTPIYKSNLNFKYICLYINRVLCEKHSIKPTSVREVNEVSVNKYKT